MKIKVFQSDKGDCLLLNGSKGGNILVDGGMKSSYKAHVRNHLGKMRRDDKVLDLVYVSHIDEDHIAGILQLVDDEIEWRRFDYHTALETGSPTIPEPNIPRPPEIKEVWHNAFHTLISKNRRRIEDSLAAMVNVFGSVEESEETIAAVTQDLITSKRQAVLLSNRLSSKQLNIPLNVAFGGKLGLRPRQIEVIDVAGMNVHVLGPSATDIRNLRKEWNGWLRTNRKLIKNLRRQAEEDAESIGNATIEDPLLISRLINARAKERGGVSLPNLASLMLHLEDGGKSILLTGDGHAEDVLEGLDRQALLRADKTIHVNVLKIPHHGSTHNFEPKKNFFKLVTADNYIFCGDGAHTNPEIEVIDMLCNSRLGNSNQRSKNPETGDKFKIWVNSHETVTKSSRKSQMRKVEKRLSQFQLNSNKKMEFRLLQTNSFDISC